MPFVKHLNPKGFQSTPPTWGATTAFMTTTPPSLISIHAPHVGSDSSYPRTLQDYQHFNPRPPRGERQQYGTKKCVDFVHVAYIFANLWLYLPPNPVSIIQILPFRGLFPVRRYGEIMSAYLSHLYYECSFRIISLLHSIMLNFAIMLIAQIIKSQTILLRINFR